MEKIYYNGSIITMEETPVEPEAVLVSDGRIAKVGTLDAVTKTAGGRVDMIDLNGKTLMPSFIDGHSHITMAIQMSGTADLSECNSCGEIVEVLKRYIERKQLTKDDFVFGMGYDHNFFPEEQHPDKRWLNKVSMDIPIYVSHVSGHMGCANDAMLRKAGIDENTQQPQGGMIGRIEGSKEPNGYLEEAGMMAVQMILANEVKIDLDKAFKDTETLYLSNGITTVQDGASAEQTVKMLIGITSKQEIGIDIISYPMLMNDGEEIFHKYPEYKNQYYNHLKLGGWKAILDGSPQGCTAWLSQPYKDRGDYCGYPWNKEEDVKKWMKTAVDSNQQILVHCNGDAAGDQFIRNYKEAYEQSSNADKDKLRPVMIHCQTVRDDQLDSMRELNMIPSVFVSHVYYWGDVHIKNLGLERGRRVSPCKSAFDRGLRVNFHQDTPVVKPKMLHSVWCAVKRETRLGKIIGEEQRCSVYDALKAITINPAYCYYEENEKGSIREGKLADLVILSKNPLKAEIDEIKDIQVLETIKEGRSVFIKK